jgi:acylphosphatase
VINTTTTGLAEKRAKEMSKIVFCEFEVFGKVQGVYFRKYTERQAIILGLRGKYYSITVLFIHVKSEIKLNSIFGCPRHCHVSLAFRTAFLISKSVHNNDSHSFQLGWCMNTQNNTVKGRLEGDQGRVMQMMEWLKTRGSPKSSIEKATFTDLKPIREFTTKTFLIKR